MRVICLHLNLLKRLASGLHTIHYVDAGGLGKVSKAFGVPHKGAYVEQTKAMQKATQEAFKEIAQEIDRKAGATEGTTSLEFKVNMREGVIKGYDMPEGYELELDRRLAIRLKTPARIYASNLNEYAWITCDLVAETLIGERAIRLLTPTPLRITSDVTVNREYVPVEISRFSLVEVKMFCNLRTMEVLDVPYTIMVVLHFTPKHKRKGVTDHGASCNSKRHCSDGCSGRILQQTSTRGISQGDVWQA